MNKRVPAFFVVLPPASRGALAPIRVPRLDLIAVAVSPHDPSASLHGRGRGRVPSIASTIGAAGARFSRARGLVPFCGFASLAAFMRVVGAGWVGGGYERAKAMSGPISRLSADCRAAI